MSYSLILKGGRVIDPSQNLDGVRDVAFADGKVAAIGDLGVARLEQMPSIADMAVERYGADIVLDGRLRYPPGDAEEPAHG